MPLLFRMQRREKGLSIRRRKIFLAVFCIVFGGLSVNIMLRTLLGAENIPTLPFAGEIKLPRLQPLENKPTVYVDTMAFRSFMHVIDSLNTSSEGQKILDSLFQQRPGLWDTLQIIKKNLY